MPKIRTVERTARERKADIMRWLGLDSTAEYNKAYDKFRNQVRNFERITGAKSVSPAYLFHDYAYSVAKKGGQFSGRINAVLAAPTTTTTGRISNARQIAVSSEYLRPFAGLISRSPKKAAQIIGAAENTEQIVQALNDYAKIVREKKDRAQSGAIPFADTDLYED